MKVSFDTDNDDAMFWSLNSEGQSDWHTWHTLLYQLQVLAYLAYLGIPISHGVFGAVELLLAYLIAPYVLYV